MSLSLLLSAKVESNSKLNFVFSLEIGKEEDERTNEHVSDKDSIALKFLLLSSSRYL